MKWEEVEHTEASKKIAAYTELLEMGRKLTPTSGAEGKEAFIKGWSNKDGASNPGALLHSADDIERYYTDHPTHNAGEIMGEGMVCLDIDRKPGQPDGFDSLLDAQEEFGKFPDTLTVETPNGGLHLYYQVSSEVKSRMSVPDYPSIEVKSRGTLVIAPGSVNPLNGRSYIVRTIFP